MGIKHKFTSGISDGADATLVRPSNWNDEHSIDYFVDIKAYGATTVSADNIAALQAAETYAFTNGRPLYIPPGTYKFTGPFRCRVGIKGEGPNVSILENIGTGDALDVGPAGYFSLWQNFAVKGNSLSIDGITLYTTTGDNPAYARFQNVTSYNHGRHGFHHRMAWATKYIECKATDNAGLGFYFDAQTGDAGVANGVSCLNCESRTNGGLGSAGTDYTKGGVRVAGAASLNWSGGIVENNNAWGFIISQQGTFATRVIHISNVYMENNPNSSSASTVGGAFNAGGSWEDLFIEKCWIGYGAKVGAIGYCFYVTGSSQCIFKESGNFTTPGGAGTNVRNYNQNNRLDWSREWVSRIIGDATVGGNPTTNTLLVASTDGGRWQISGLIYCKRDSDLVGGVYPFIAARDSNAAAGVKQVSVGTALGGLSASTAPTMAWAGTSLQITFAAYHYGSVSLSMGSALGFTAANAPEIVLNKDLFPTVNNDGAGTMAYQTDLILF